MKRKIFNVRNDSDTLSMTFIQCTDDGDYIEGWHISVGHDNMPGLRYATYRKDDPSLIPLEEKGTL